MYPYVYLARTRHLLVYINTMQSCEFIACDLMCIVNINLFDSCYYFQRNPVLLPSVPVISCVSSSSSCKTLNRKLYRRIRREREGKKFRIYVYVGRE